MARRLVCPRCGGSPVSGVGAGSARTVRVRVFLRDHEFDGAGGTTSGRPERALAQARLRGIVPAWLSMDEFVDIATCYGAAFRDNVNLARQYKPSGRVPRALFVEVVEATQWPGGEAAPDHSPRTVGVGGPARPGAGARRSLLDPSAAIRAHASGGPGHTHDDQPSCRTLTCFRPGSRGRQMTHADPVSSWPIAPVAPHRPGTTAGRYRARPLPTVSTRPPCRPSRGRLPRSVASLCCSRATTFRTPISSRWTRRSTRYPSRRHEAGPMSAAGTSRSSWGTDACRSRVWSVSP